MKLTPEPLSILERIYLESFPLEERRNWEEIIEPKSSYGPIIHVIYDKSGLSAGLLTYWAFDTFVYIEHFAVDSAQRGHGVGTAALTGFISEQSKPIVLEIERPEVSADATRRYEFYRRIGFLEIAKDYVQPPYYPGLSEVPMWLLSNDEFLDPGMVESVLHKKVYKK